MIYIYAVKPDLFNNAKEMLTPAKGSLNMCLQANIIIVETSGKNQMWNVQMTLKAYILKINV